MYACIYVYACMEKNELVHLSWVYLCIHVCMFLCMNVCVCSVYAYVCMYMYSVCGLIAQSKELLYFLMYCKKYKLINIQ